MVVFISGSNLRYRVTPGSLAGSPNCRDPEPVALSAAHRIHDRSGLARRENVGPVQFTSGIHGALNVIGPRASHLFPADANRSIRDAGKHFHMGGRLKLPNAG